MPAIRASSVLPARREPLRLQTADGLELVGELAVPADRDPVATLICLHPLPKRFARVPQAEVVGVDGAKHLWVGDAETVLDLVFSRVAPARSPLPREWDGPMQTADSSAYADRTVAAFSDVPVAGPED
jgi:uncharacterized protein